MIFFKFFIFKLILNLSYGLILKKENFDEENKVTNSKKLFEKSSNEKSLINFDNLKNETFLLYELNEKNLKKLIKNLTEEFDNLNYKNNESNYNKKSLFNNSFQNLFVKSSNNFCSITKCISDCETQDLLKNEKSGYCKSSNLCECCTLKHESCIITQKRCKTLGLKAICNSLGRCTGKCACTLNSCSDFCNEKFVKSNNSVNLLDSLTNFQELSSITNSVKCVSGRCICADELIQNLSETEEKPKLSLFTDDKMNSLLDKMLINNQRIKIYDELHKNFSNMIRSVKLIINQILLPETLGLNFPTKIISYVTPSRNFNFDEKIEKNFNSTKFNEDNRRNFLNILENRFERFRNQRNSIISKLIELVAIERKANRIYLSKYLDELRVLLASNLDFSLTDFDDSDYKNLDDLNSVFLLTNGLSNGLQLISNNLN